MKKLILLLFFYMNMGLSFSQTMNDISSSLGLVGNFGGPTEIVNFFQNGLDDLENSLPALLDDYLILQFKRNHKYKMGVFELGFNPNDETFHVGFDFGFEGSFWISNGFLYGVYGGSGFVDVRGSYTDFSFETIDLSENGYNVNIDCGGFFGVCCILIEDLIGVSALNYFVANINVNNNDTYFNRGGYANVSRTELKFFFLF